MIPYPTTPILDWLGWRLGVTPVIPKFYYDAYSQEEIIKELSKELDCIAKYAQYLGTEMNTDRKTINQVAELLNELQAGGWFKEYEDIIKAWIEDIHNLTELVDEAVTEAVTPIKQDITEEFEAQNRRIDTFDNRITDNTTNNAEDAVYLNSQTNGNLFIAHRGARYVAPENTVEAFNRASEFMYDGVEFDIHATSDGEIVVCHDSNINSYTNGVGLIESLTLATIKQYPITKGTWRDYASGYTPETYIPTLDEALNAIQKGGFERIYCEFKIQTQWSTELYTKVYEAFEKRRMLDKVVFCSFGRTVLLNMKKLNRHIKTAIILGTPSQEAIDVEHTYGIDEISMPYSVGADLHTYAHNLGITTSVYALGADNSVYNALDFNAKSLFIDTLGHITRTTTDVRLTPYGKMNKYGGATYPAFCKYARVQGDSGGFLPSALSPYEIGTASEPDYGAASFPAWRGQVSRMSTPIFYLQPGTLVEWQGASTYKLSLRMFSDDFTSYYDPNEWITTNGVIGITPRTSSNLNEGVPVIFIAARNDDKVLTELDAKRLTGCLRISNAVGTLKFGSIYNGIVNGFSWRLQGNASRLMSPLMPTTNGASIPIPNTTLTDVAVYIFNALGKRLVDSGVQTPGSTYTVQTTNAAYFRYVYLLRADSSKPITPRAYGEACLQSGMLG